MDSPLLLGIDVGSSRVKALLARRDGSALAVARRPTPTVRLADGGTIHPVAELLGAVEDAIVDALSAAPDAGSVAGIGIAGMAEAGVALDRHDRPIGDVLAWFDPRPAAEADEIGASVGAEALFARTGLRAGPKTTLAKLLWLRRRRPAAARRLRRWAGVPELVGLALTGRLGTDVSLACRTMALDLAARRWDEGLLGLAGLTGEAMPSILPPGRPIGGLEAGVAARHGLIAGTPVAIAGHDHLVGALGAGVIRPGQALDSIGSAEACLLVTDRPMLDDAVRRAGFSVGLHPLDGRAYVVGGLQSSGAFVDWFIESFLGPGEDGRRAFRDLLDRAPAGPTGIVVGPWLRGRTVPAPDPAAAASFAGLRAAHDRASLALAVLEGTAFAVRWILEDLERVTDRRVGRVRVVGGGSRDGHWMRARAAILPWRLEVADTEEATALGAALVGGVAGGLFGSAHVAVRVAAAGARPCAVAPSLRAAYDGAYRSTFLAAFASGTGASAGTNAR